MITNELLEKVLAVIDKQIAAICNDIIEDGCISHNNSSLIVPISTLCNLIGASFKAGDDDGAADGQE